EAGVVAVDGSAIRVTRASDGVLRVGDARLVQPGLIARNGMLHGVDRVTLPDSARAEATSAAP
ncbi:MAG TPA: fasciclin domain-containing protein, partial [Gemmatimonadales bacterium]|nr:fasciclin domain-containing protein [Gemmatimonadales bacterium]